MFEKVPRKSKQEALLLNAQGMTEESAAKACGISERTLRRAKAKYRKFGDVEGGVKKTRKPTFWIPAFKDVTTPSLSPLMCRKF
jgi:Homeodomain-like domain